MKKIKEYLNFYPKNLSHIIRRNFFLCGHYVPSYMICDDFVMAKRGYIWESCKCFLTIILTLQSIFCNGYLAITKTLRPLNAVINSQLKFRAHRMYKSNHAKYQQDKDILRKTYNLSCIHCNIKWQMTHHFLERI